MSDESQSPQNGGAQSEMEALKKPSLWARLTQLARKQQAADDAPEGAEKEEMSAISQMISRVLVSVFNFIDTIFKYRMAIIIGVVGIVVLGAGSKIGLTLYINSLLNQGITEIRQGKYSDAVANINRYINAQEESSEEAELWLARAYIFSGQEYNIGSLLKRKRVSDPEVRHIRALANYTKSPLDAGRILRIPNDDAAAKKLGRTHPYVFAAAGIFKLLADEPAEATKPLATAADNMPNVSGEDAFIIQNYMRALYSMFNRHGDLKVYGELAVTLTGLSAINPALTQQLGFELGADSFHNRFEIPFRDIAVNLSSSSAIADEYHALALLAQTMNDPENAITAVNQAADSELDKALLAKYIIGYYQALNSDHAAAAQTYLRINQQQGSVYSHLYEAATAWQAQKDTFAPDKRVMDAYKQALHLAPRNIQALNNYAVMELYSNNIDNAAKLIKPISGDAANFDAFVFMNHAIIGILQGGLDIDNEITRMERVIDIKPNLSLVNDIMSELHLLAGNFLKAGSFLNKNVALQPKNPAVPLALADIYRLNGRQFLSASTLDKAFKSIRNNEQITHALIADKARLNDTKAVALLLKQKKIPKNSATWLYAEALLTKSDPAQAAQFADRALAAAADNAQKIDIALDTVRFHLMNGMADAARAALSVADSLEETHISNKYNYLMLQALELWADAVDGVADKSEINDLLAEAKEQHNVFARFDLYWAMAVAGDADAAIRKLDSEQAKTTGYSPRLLRALAFAHQQAGNLKAFERLNKRIVSIENKAEVAVYDDEAEADSQKVFGKAKKGDSKTLAKTLAKIDAAINAENYKRAIELYGVLIEEENIDEIFSSPALTFMARGGLYASLKKYDEAIDDFLQALSMKDERMTPEQEIAINYNLANALVYGKRFPEAEKLLVQLTESEEQKDHQHTYLRLLGFVVNSQGRPDEAKDIYQRLIDNFPPDDIGVISVYFAIANIARVQRDYPLTIKTLSQALEIDPNNVKIHRALVSSYTQIKDNENANLHRKIIKDLTQ